MTSRPRSRSAVGGGRTPQGATNSTNQSLGSVFGFVSRTLLSKPRLARQRSCGRGERSSRHRCREAEEVREPRRASILPSGEGLGPPEKIHSDETFSSSRELGPASATQETVSPRSTETRHRLRSKNQVDCVCLAFRKCQSQEENFYNVSSSPTLLFLGVCLRGKKINRTQKAKSAWEDSSIIAFFPFRCSEGISASIEIQMKRKPSVSPLSLARREQGGHGQKRAVSRKRSSVLPTSGLHRRGPCGQV